MLLKRPLSFELEVSPPADYQSALAAMSLASLRDQGTRIRCIERTADIRRFEEFLASGGVRVHWGDRALVVEPEEKMPFTFLSGIPDYDAFSFMLVLAATRAGSRVRVITDPDDTVEMLLLALRRAGAEFEASEEQPAAMIVRKPIDRPIKYQLRKESAKITPQLVVAFASLEEISEISDLFDWGRFDYIFEKMIARFERVNLQEDEATDEVELRLRRRARSPHEHQTKVLVGGGLTDEPAAIELRPDAEFAAYLVAGAVNHPRGRLVLRGFRPDDLTHTPLSQMRRMGVEFKPAYSDGVYSLTVLPSELKSRRIGYEHLHAFPDSVGALALANAPLDATTVIRTAPYSTDREERRRRRLCEVIKSLGARVAEISDGIVLEGKRELAAGIADNGDDPFASLTAAAACLGPVEQIELADPTAAESHWGDCFRALLELLQ